MAESENCSQLLKKAFSCIMKIMLDNLHIVLIIFVLLFMMVGVYQTGFFNNKSGINRGSGLRNQIEMFKNKKRGKKSKN